MILQQICRYNGTRNVQASGSEAGPSHTGQPSDGRSVLSQARPVCRLPCLGRARVGPGNPNTPKGLSPRTQSTRATHFKQFLRPQPGERLRTEEMLRLRKKVFDPQNHETEAPISSQCVVVRSPAILCTVPRRSYRVFSKVYK